MDYYEKKYNEALERAKKELAACGSMDCDAARQIFRLFPQLHESEDERMIRKIESFLSAYDAYYFKNDEWREIEVWLEKQKELFESGRGLYYYDGEKTTYCGYPATEDNPYDFAMSQQKEQKPADLSEMMVHKEPYLAPVPTPMVADEQKPISTEDMPYVADEHFYEREQADSFKYRLAEYMTKNCIREEGEGGYTYKINSETILEMAKEELIKRDELQKPVEFGLWKDTKKELPKPDSLILVQDFDVIRSLYYEGDGYLDKADNIKLSIYQKWCYQSDVKKIKPMEWSEEDEMYLSQAIETLEHENYSILADKLKSLRPPKDCSGCSKHLEGYISGRSDAENKLLEMYGILLMPDGELRMKPQWKPSEEQMKALQHAIDACESEWAYQDDELRSLLNDLKKLM